MIALSLVSISVVGMGIGQVVKSGTFSARKKRKSKILKNISVQEMQQRGPVPTESTDAINPCLPQPSAALNVDRSVYGYYTKI